MLFRSSCLTGFFAIFFTTFGTLIIFIGTLAYATITGFRILGLKPLLILLILYLCGELLEYVFIVVGAKKFGASNKAAIGALVGGIVGAMIGLSIAGIGAFLGALLGIFSGAFLVEYLLHRDIIRSIKAGTGGVIGRIGLIFAKMVLVGIMFWVIISNIYPYYRY